MLKMYRSGSDVTKAYIQMHLSILLWGFTGVLGRAIQLQEGMLVWWRVLITSISLLIYLKAINKSIAISKRDFFKLSGIGALLAVHWLFFYGAIKYSNVSVTLSTFATTALFTAILDPLVHGKKIRKDEIGFSLIALLGVWLVFSSETHFSFGIILALFAAFVGAFFNILNKEIVGSIPTDVVTFYEITGGLIFLTIGLPFYISIIQPAQLFPTSTDWVLLLFLSVVCTQVTMILSLSALKHLSAFTLNLAINLEPVYGIALAFMVYQENKELHWGFFAGSAVIMTGVILHALYAKHTNNH